MQLLYQRFFFVFVIPPVSEIDCGKRDIVNKFSNATAIYTLTRKKRFFWSNLHLKSI